eukprot:jgi/Ulvmu1/10465/UM064_0002.1
MWRHLITHGGAMLLYTVTHVRLSPRQLQKNAVLTISVHLVQSRAGSAKAEMAARLMAAFALHAHHMEAGGTDRWQVHAQRRVGAGSAAGSDDPCCIRTGIIT